MGKYTNIDDPSAYFQTALHSSANAATITNDGNSDLQPDLIWSKARGAAYNHGLYDSTRGVTKFLSSNATSAETTASSGFDLTSFNTDGFSTGNNQYNTICGGTTYAAWQWKANGGTTSSNTDGSITSTVQANTDAGFSIVTFTSAASSGTGIFSVGHGLGQIPAMVITKNRGGSASNWWTWHKGLTGGNSNTSYIVALERITAEGSYSNAWGAGMTSSVFGMQSGNPALASTDYLAYCFAEKQGYSKFGKYVGNGNSNGPFVYTGFKPTFVMQKRTDSTGAWHMFDSKRNLFNEVDNYLYANTSEAEYVGSNDGVDFLSNGFKISNTYTGLNASGGTYIYMAFAENPFVTSTGIMGTAR